MKEWSEHQLSTPHCLLPTVCPGLYPGVGTQSALFLELAFLGVCSDNNRKGNQTADLCGMLAQLRAFVYNMSSFLNTTRVTSEVGFGCFFFFLIGGSVLKKILGQWYIIHELRH